MYLTAMTHRDELFDITLRWMNDDLKPEDGKKITRIFLYESALSIVVIDRTIQFLGRLFNDTLQIERISQKQALRERIITFQSNQNPRMQDLAVAFHENPKYYFPYLPVDAIVVTASDASLVSIGRIKRLSRVAEKVSFRLVEALFKEIQVEAKHLAEQRARVAGVELSGFVSSERAMQNDFLAAEGVVAGRFKNKNVRIEREALTINDIIGFKIICRPEMQESIPQMLNREIGVTVVEIQRHSGDYNAVNLLVDIDLPSSETLVEYLLKFDWHAAPRRGLSLEDVRENVLSYVDRGATSIRIELILTTYEELMEAEFGRSIHELRILRLRQRQAYCGPLGQNAGYLIEYMLALASSPTVSVPEIPIKMYGRYLPESIAALKNALYGNDIDGGLLSTFRLQQGGPDKLF